MAAAEPAVVVVQAEPMVGRPVDAPEADLAAHVASRLMARRVPQGPTAQMVMMEEAVEVVAVQV